MAMDREGIKSLTLAVLVLISLVLSAALFFDLAGGRPRLLVTYVAEGNQAKVSMAELLAPRRLVWHQGGRHFILAESGEGGARVESAVRRALLGLMTRSGPEAASVDAQAVTDWRQMGEGMEILWPVELPLRDWARVWGEERSVGAGWEALPMTRLALFVQPDGSLVVLAGNARGWSRAGTLTGAAAGEVLAQGSVIRTEGLAGHELVERWTHLKPAAGIFVPDGPLEMGPLLSENERVEETRLARTFFPDPAALRSLRSEDGSLMFTDGQKGLMRYPDGAITYSSPGGPRGKDQGKLAAIDTAAAFIGSHGGWPGGTRLLLAEGLVGRDGNLVGYRVAFANHFGSYPILGGLEAPHLPGVPDAGIPAPLEVVMAPGSNGALWSYLRGIRQRFSEQTRESLPVPEKALDALDALWPGRFGTGRPGLVRDVFPAYHSRWSGEGSFRMSPVWAIELDGGRLVLVDGAGEVFLAGEAPRGGK